MPRYALQLLLLTALSTIATVPAFATPTVGQCIAATSPLSEKVARIVEPDGYQQWLVWEQTANSSEYRQPNEAMTVNYVDLPKLSVDVRYVTGVDPVVMNGLIYNGDRVRWLFHPDNLATTVPHFDDRPTGSIGAYYTASRSMALIKELRGYTVKMATDHPHGRLHYRQNEKANNSEDVRASLFFAEHIRQRDLLLGGPMEDVIILPDVASVSDSLKGIGYVVRDARALDDGNFYLPGFSIPWVGRRIAELNGAEFEPFWQKYYAEALGRAKAQLFLRYGIQMETPNSQNILVQLDRDLRPTGRIVLRDLGDSHFVEPFASQMGFTEPRIRLREAGIRSDSYLRPYGFNSMRMDEFAHDQLPEWHFFSRDEAKPWIAAHNEAYLTTLLATLGLPYFPRMLDESGWRGWQWSNLYRYLESDVGHTALATWAKKSQPRP